MTDVELQEITSAFDDRVGAMFRADAGRPLVRAEKRPPLGPGRGNYVRHYSFSIVEFAARCFYLGEMLDEANAALIENTQHYRDHPRDINDRDSFHWHAEVLLRFIEQYGRSGRTAAGRLSPEAEGGILDIVWRYAKKHSLLAGAEIRESETWHIRESENHHVQIFTLAWHFAKLAADTDEYVDREYDDGGTAADHFAAWNAYLGAYCAERAKKGMFVEMQNDGYNGILLKGMYNCYDFGDEDVRKAVGQFLDLYFAYWAQEQIDGVQGGGRARIYPGGAITSGGRHVQQLAWLYFGMGEAAGLFSPILTAALSDYRPPAVVADIALDAAGRGRYEIRQRPLGLVKSGFYNPPDYRMRTDAGGIVRYSYCDPSFIVGTAMLEARPMEDWAMISSQNRWHGVIFAGHRNARIVPLVRAEDDRANFNQQWSVQCRGTLICQKLATSTKCGDMRVWFSGDGLGDPVEEAGWVFVEAAGAYAGVRVVSGAYRWEPETSPSGMWMTLENDISPVIVEVVSKADAESFAAFRTLVKGQPAAFDGSLLDYESVYGDHFLFHADQSEPPSINGEPVDYAPAKAFDSPFLDGYWDSGVVTIRKDGREKVLTFQS